jgi:LSD1 subclass zinc finger protein
MNGRIGIFLMISSLFLCALLGCASYSTCVGCIKPVHYLQLTTALLQLTGASSVRCSLVCLAIFTPVDVNWPTDGIRLVQWLNGGTTCSEVVS